MNILLMIPKSDIIMGDFNFQFNQSKNTLERKNTILSYMEDKRLNYQRPIELNSIHSKLDHSFCHQKLTIQEYTHDKNAAKKSASDHGLLKLSTRPADVFEALGLN